MNKKIYKGDGRVCGQRYVFFFFLRRTCIPLHIWATHGLKGSSAPPPPRPRLTPSKMYRALRFSAPPRAPLARRVYFVGVCFPLIGSRALSKTEERKKKHTHNLKVKKRLCLVHRHDSNPPSFRQLGRSMGSHAPGEPLGRSGGGGEARAGRGVRGER